MKRILLSILLCCASVTLWAQVTYTSNVFIDDIYWQSQNEWNGLFHAVLYLNGDSIASSNFTHNWYTRVNGVGEFQPYTAGGYGPSNHQDLLPNQYYQMYVRIDVPGYGLVQSNTVTLAKYGDPEQVEFFPVREDGSPLSLAQVNVVHWTEYRWRDDFPFLNDGEFVKIRYSRSLGEKFYRGEHSPRGDIRWMNYDSYPVYYGEGGSHVPNDLIFRHRVQRDAAVRSQVVEIPSQYYSIEFKDPWLEDSGLLGGELRSQGMSASFKSVGYDPQNPYNLGINTAYKGVFLNQTVNSGIYYSARAPLITIINGSTAFFTGWNYDPNHIELEQVGSNPPGYDQKAVIFKQAGAVLTAQYTNSTISQNTTIPAGTFPMAGSLTVSSGVTLTLNPGTTLEFPSGATLTANGKITATGTSGQKVTFTRRSGSSDWYGISFSGSGASGSSLQHCIISFAKQPLVASNAGSLTISNTTVDNSTFYDMNPNDAAALRFYNSSPTITYVTITGGNGEDGGEPSPYGIGTV